MKKIVLLFVILILSSGMLHSQFSNTGGPGGGKVLAMYSMGNSVYAGTETQGVFVYDGSGWTQKINGMGAQKVNCLAGWNSTLYAGTNTNLYKSTNNGAQWTIVNYGGMNQVTALAVTENSLYVGSNLGEVFKSVNNQYDWSLLANFSSTGRINSILLDNNNIYLAANGVYFTTNDGENWLYDPVDEEMVFTLHSDGSTIRAGTSNGGMKTTAPFGAWVRDIPWVNPVKGYIKTGNYILAGMSAGWFWSSDNGQSWNDPNSNYMPGTHVYSVAQNSQYIFAGTDNGVYKRSILELTGISPVNSNIPESYSLLQNYPNPFNPETKIRFSIPRSANVKLIVFNQLGETVMRLVDQNVTAGNYEYRFDASGLSSGVYFYSITAEDFKATKKMILIR